MDVGLQTWTFMFFCFFFSIGGGVDLNSFTPPFHMSKHKSSDKCVPLVWAQEDHDEHEWLPYTSAVNTIILKEYDYSIRIGYKVTCYDLNICSSLMCLYFNVWHVDGEQLMFLCSSFSFLFSWPNYSYSPTPYGGLASIIVLKQVRSWWEWHHRESKH